MTQQREITVTVEAECHHCGHVVAHPGDRVREVMRSRVDEMPVDTPFELVLSGRFVPVARCGACLGKTNLLGKVRVTATRSIKCEHCDGRGRIPVIVEVHRYGH